MSDTNAEKQIDPKAYETRIPRNIYRLRVRECDTVTTKEKGYKMFKYVSEIIPKKEGIPTVIKLGDGNSVCIDGLEFYHQSVVTEKALKFFNNFRSAVGLSEITAEDISRVDGKEALGLEFFAECVGTEETKMNEETKEPLTDPYTGAVMKQLSREIKTFIGRPKN